MKCNQPPVYILALCVNNGVNFSFTMLSSFILFPQGSSGDRVPKCFRSVAVGLGSIAEIIAFQFLCVSWDAGADIYSRCSIDCLSLF